jgi:hypothetical protein
MPDLDFQITGVKPAQRGLTPLLHFSVRINVSPATEAIQALILQAQIQIQSPQRTYKGEEKERLLDIFGPRERWGQTLRNRLWTQTNTTTGPFTGSTEAILAVPCTFDLNVLATKYFQALAEGDIPLLFLFSGSIFYGAEDGRLQVQRISWEKECVYRMPLRAWQELMEHHYPNTAWLSLRRDTFDRLCAYKRAGGLSTWEETIERLLPELEGLEAMA